LLSRRAKTLLYRLTANQAVICGEKTVWRAKLASQRWAGRSVLNQKRSSVAVGARDALHANM
jgi:hypothetical protein